MTTTERKAPAAHVANCVPPCLPYVHLERILRCCEQQDLEFGQVFCKADRSI